MTIELTYRATTSFSSDDIRDVADNEPLVYEIWANRPTGWTAKAKAFLESGADNVDLALDIVGLSLVAVSQAGQRYPCAGRGGAEALRETIEAQNPGYGDDFIRTLAVSIFDQQLKREDARLGNSKTPSAQSADGSSPSG